MRAAGIDLGGRCETGDKNGKGSSIQRAVLFLSSAEPWQMALEKDNYLKIMEKRYYIKVTC